MTPSMTPGMTPSGHATPLLTPGKLLFHLNHSFCNSNEFFSKFLHLGGTTPVGHKAMIMATPTPGKGNNVKS